MSARAKAGLWWLSPAGALSLLVPLTLLLTAYLNDADFRLFYRSPKSVTGTTLLLIAMAVLVLAIAATVTSRLARPGRVQLLPEGRPVPRQLHTAASCLFWVTIVGYTAFTASGVIKGVRLADVISVLFSQDNYAGNLKDEFNGVAGISTLTQCGMAFMVLATYLLLRERNRRLFVQIAVIVLLTVLRSFLASERLAIVEVAVPAVAVLAQAARRSRHRPRRVLARVAPLLLAPLLVLLFAAFEYSRSWQFFKGSTNESFGVFAVIRLAGYYATSYNNGQLELLHDTFTGRLPYDSLLAFWTAPGITQLGLYEKLSAAPPASATDILERFGNPEFNNLGGVTTPFVDFGLVGGFVFFILAGIGIGFLYRGFRDGTVVGALLYPLALTGLLDLPRYLYWTQGRVVPAVVALVVVALAIGRSRRKVHRATLPRRREPSPEQRLPELADA